MGKWEKVRDRVLSGSSDKNIKFDDLCGLLERMGFDESICGDHHKFRRGDVEYQPDLQPQRDGKAKRYQVVQVRSMLVNYELDREEL